MISYKNGKLVVKGEKAELFKDACAILYGLAKVMEKDPGELGKDLVNAVLTMDSADILKVSTNKKDIDRLL